MIKVKCSFCQKILLRKPCQLKRSVHFFCNQICKGKWRSANESGINSLCYKSILVKCFFCKRKLKREPWQIKKNKHHFCNSICMGRWYKENRRGENNYHFSKKVKVECSNCGRIFERIPSLIKNSTRNYFCNKHCFTSWQKNNLRGEQNPFYNRGKVACENCGKILFRILSKIKKNKFHFCDRTCYGSWKSKEMKGKEGKKKRIKIKCDFCGQEIERIPSEIGYYKRYFCNVTCKGFWMSKYLQGTKALGWKNGASFEPYPISWTKSLRISIRRRDEFKCQLCNAPQEEFSVALPVHHIDYDKKNCKKENLIALCPSHNSKVNKNRNYWTKFFRKLLSLRIHGEQEELFELREQGLEFLENLSKKKKKSIVESICYKELMVGEKKDA